MARRIVGEGSIRERKDGLFEVRLWTKADPATGKRKRISRYGHSHKEAVQLLTQLQLQYGIGNAVPVSYTVGAWLTHWLGLYARPSVKHSTFVSYEGYVRNHLIPSLGGIKLDKLLPSDIQRLYVYKLEKEGLSSKSISNLHACLHRALQQAVKEQLLPGNPCDAVDLPRKEEKEISILTRDEQKLLLKESYKHRYGVFVRLALSTGLRIGEVVGLHWNDVDLVNKTLFVRSTLNRLPTVDGKTKTEIVTSTPKTRNGRRAIPLFDAIISDLREWGKTQQRDAELAGEAYRNGGYVVTNELGGPIEPRTFRDYYVRMLKDAGLPHFTFHALRHTFATRAIEQGMDIKALSKILGHASVGFTLDTYAHLLDDHKRESMMLMQDLYVSPSQPVAKDNLIYLSFGQGSAAKD